MGTQAYTISKNCGNISIIKTNKTKTNNGRILWETKLE